MEHKNESLSKSIFNGLGVTVLASPIFLADFEKNPWMPDNWKNGEEGNYKGGTTADTTVNSNGGWYVDSTVTCFESTTINTTWNGDWKSIDSTNSSVN